MNKIVKKLVSLLIVLAIVFASAPSADLSVRAEDTAASVHTAGPDEILEMCNPVGRLVKYNDTVFMESSASNFTLRGEFEGDIVLDITVEQIVNEYHNLFVEIDGTMHYFELEAGRQSVVVAEDLSAGYHTVQISKGPEAKKEIYYIHGVTYTGTLEKAEPAEHRIEFLGDSITAGTGVYQYVDGFGGTHSYFTYANMTADALGADYYSVANGGWKFSQSISPSDSIGTIYEKLSMHKNLGNYDFSWKPELVVINLGTNDAIANRKNDSYTADTYMADVATLLDMVRKNNPDAQIIWVYGMMLKENESWVQAAVDAYAQKDEKVQYLHLNGNTAGRGDHPNQEGHITAAKMLIDAICEIMGWTADPAKDPVAISNQQKIATAARIRREAADIDFSKNYCPACGEIDGWTKLGDGQRSYPGTSIGSSPNFTGDQHFYWDPADYNNATSSVTVYNWLQTSGTTNVCLHLNGMTLNYTGRVHWGGTGTLNIMGDGSMNSLGKCNATTNAGNLYINGSGTINLYGGRFTSGNTVALSKPAKTTDPRYATLSIHKTGATVNIYDGVVLESGCGTNVAADIGTVNMYGGTLKDGTGYPYHSETITADTTQWQTCGGNVYLYGQSATNQAVFNMYGGLISGGAAQYGGNVFAFHNSSFNLYGGTMVDGIADTGNNIYVSDKAALAVGYNWNGYATVAFDTEYNYGAAVQNGTSNGTFLGELLYEGIEMNPRIFGIDGKLVVSPVCVYSEDDICMWAKENADAVVLQQENAGSYICVLLPDSVFDLPAGKHVYIDFNGQNTKVTGNGTLYGMDRCNDAFQASNCAAVAVADSVTVVTDVTGGANAYRYIAVTEGADVYGFHRLDAKLKSVTLRTAAAGLYYKAVYNCDDVLSAKVKSYGVVLSLKDMPGADFMTEMLLGEKNGFTVSNQPFKSGVEATSGSVFGIMKTGNTPAINAANGKTKIYANAYLYLDGIGVLVGDTVNPGKTATDTAFNGSAFSLYDVLKEVDKNWNAYSEYHSQLLGFYDAWENYGMNSWADDFVNIA